MFIIIIKNILESKVRKKNSVSRPMELSDPIQYHKKNK